MHDSADLNPVGGHFTNQLDVPIAGPAGQFVGFSLRSSVVRGGDGD